MQYKWDCISKVFNYPRKRCHLQTRQTLSWRYNQKINSKLTKAGFGDKQILSSDAKGYANLKNRIAVRKNEKIWEKYETPKLFSLTDIERSLD